MKDETERKRARGLDRALDILDHLRAVKIPRRPSEIAQAIGAPKSTVYDLVASLVDHGMLEATEDGGLYLGRRLYFLGLAYQDHFDLTRRAQSVLAELSARTQEMAQFCMLDGNKYTVALQVEGSRPFRISADIGQLTPIPWTASGRLLLGGMTSDQILALLPPEDFALPDGRLMDKDDFFAEIRDATSAGFFSFDSIVDTFTHCFAAPVKNGHGKCVATVCIIAPKEDAIAKYNIYRSALMEAGQELSKFVP